MDITGIWWSLIIEDNLMIKRLSALNILICFTVICNLDINAQTSLVELSFSSEDKTMVSAYWQTSTKPKISPTIVLFHQASASARGEYKDIYPKLVSEGFNVLMVDLRSGGSKFGGINKTVKQLNNKKFSYCEAYPDMSATLSWLKTQNLSGPVVVWGSSYSAGLAFKLTAENKDIDGVLGFSPASGKPMQGCRPDGYLEKIAVPAIAFRPASEMEYGSVKAQADIFKTHDIPYVSIKDGVHGSSMLVEERTKHNMQHAWHQVLTFLSQFK